MISTLPRLYAINDDGTCYIKPKLGYQGVFNSTMKYIFGTNYSSENIQIYCWTKMHEPTLVITSEEIYENKLKTYADEDIEMLPYEAPLESEEFFNDTDHLCDSGFAITECESIRLCIQSGMSDCDDEWSLFTNRFWQMLSEGYERIRAISNSNY